jgi:hypothetical protein
MIRGVVRKVFNSSSVVRPLELVGLFQQLEEGHAFLPKLADEATQAAIIPVSFITSFFPVGRFILQMASTLVGFASMSRWLTMKPRSLRTEDAFLRVELPAVAPEVDEGLGEIDDEVVFVSGLNDHVVDVGFNILADLGFQALLDGLLVGRSSVLEAEGHGRVAVDVVRHYERRLILVRDLQGYLVIA